MNYVTLREANEARSTEWGKGEDIPLEFRIAELAGETGEVCNDLKKLYREQRGWRGSRVSLEHLAEELADVVICTDLVALGVKMDLDVERQLTYAGRARNLLRGGIFLSAVVGRLCERFNYGYPIHRVDLINILQAVAEVANTAGVDLRAAVAAKFNATSEKVGLQTKMAA